MEETRKNTGNVTSEQILSLLTPEERDRAAEMVGEVLDSTVKPLAGALAQGVVQSVTWASQVLQNYANSPEGRWLREALDKSEVIDRMPIRPRGVAPYEASLITPRVHPAHRRVVELYEASRSGPRAHPIDHR